jgi:hypothetical protein
MSFSFRDHVALLSEFLRRRRDIVDSIESRLLNVSGKDIGRTRHRVRLQQVLDSCFFNAPGLPPDLARLKGQLAAAYLAEGFEPISLEGDSHEFDPLGLIVRAYRHWDIQRWPGKNVRLPYAQTLYSAFMLRQFEHLSLRIWDEGNDAAGDRLQAVQRLLDGLNEATDPNVFVRDARWLIQTAQGPLTRRLQPYFRIAEQISGSFTDAGRLELHKAGARLTGGHLRSQLRHRAGETGRPMDDPEVLAITRNSNSMDAALLVRDLVPLLEAYEAARAGRDLEQRLDLADAILQGVSADPGLLLTRLDLLTPATMIEDLFIDCGEDGRARYTRLGDEHLRVLGRYRELIASHAASLEEDALTRDPRDRPYSPFGIAYGFCGDLLSNMALGTLRAQPSFGLSLEDIFAGRGNLEDRRACAEHLDHSVEWAELIFAHMTSALHARAARQRELNASDFASAQLFVIPESDSDAPLQERVVPGGVVPAQEHFVTSDLKRALASGATAFPRTQMVADRNEGRFLASAERDGKWFGISKVILTTCTGQGKDALVIGVPPPVIEVLRLTCPGLLQVASGSV